jgi:hypothetical protein
MRVLHAPVNVGNQPWTLSRAERSQGVASDLVVNYSTWLGYPADRVLSTHGAKSPIAIARRLAFGLSAPFRYDVLHYYFGRSLLVWDDLGANAGFPFLDARLAHRIGRKVFFTLQGCDVRLAGESNRRNAVTMCRLEQGCSLFRNCIAGTDARRLEMLAQILPISDRVFYLNPELGHYVPGAAFLPYANVAVDEVLPAARAFRKRPLVLHAPSDDWIKGSPLIEAALRELAKSYDFEYIAVRGKPHQEAMQLYASADLVIDQALAGWYGGFAVETMSMAKPVACYLRQEDLDFLPATMRAELPLLTVDPRRLVDDLARVFERRHEWADVGEASRRYVSRWHNPRKIAAAMIEAYRDPRSRFALEEHV